MGGLQPFTAPFISYLHLPIGSFWEWLRYSWVCLYFHCYVVEEWQQESKGVKNKELMH